MLSRQQCRREGEKYPPLSVKRVISLRLRGGWDDVSITPPGAILFAHPCKEGERLTVAASLKSPRVAQRDVLIKNVA